MFRAAIAFFVLAILAFILGEAGIANVSMEIGHVLLVVFLVLAVFSFLGSIITGRNLKQIP